MNSLIIGKNPIVIDEEIATALSLTEAVIIQKIWYWMKISKESKDAENRIAHYKDGRWWTYQTLDDWCKAIPYISRKTIQRHLGNLEKKGIIITGNYNKMPIDRTKWYSINEYALIKAVRPCGQNDQMPCGQNDHTNNHKNTIPKNTELKYRDTNYCSKERNNLSISINKSMDYPCSASVDLHNLENLSATLDDCIHIAKGYDGHEYAYILFSSFAQEYKRVRHRKHTRVNRDKLIEYVDKLTAFRVKKENGETYRTFSIYDYREKDIVAMVDDYFNTKFDDCDYSLHHFMSDGVLATRFWHLEKMLGEEEEEVASI